MQASAINTTVQQLRLRLVNGPTGQFFQWWGEELRNALPSRLRARLKYAQRQLLMQVGDGEISLSIAGDSSIQALDALTSTEDTQLQQQQIQKLLQQHELTEVSRVLLVADTDVLRSEVVMPLAAEANLRQALAYEMDRNTPFQADEVFYGWRVLDRDRDAGQLTFELIVVPRESVESDIEMLKGFGLAPSSVDVVTASGPLGVNLLPVAMRYRMANPRTRSNWLLAAVTTLLLVLVMVQSIGLREHQINAIETAIKDVRTQALAVQQIRKQIDDASEAAGFMQKHKSDNGYKLEMMAELTRILPQNTYLDRLTLHADTVQMQGKSDNAQALIELVNASPIFENASFRGPTRLDNASHKEIFDLNASVSKEDAG